MKRRWVRGVFALLAVAGVGFGAERAGLFGIPGWKRVPSLTIVSSPDDPRIPAVREAVAFWNQTFAELGSPFRLGAITLVTGSVSELEMRDLSEQSLHHFWRATLPASLDAFPGDLLVVLSDATFISFAARDGRRTVVGIKNGRAPPLPLPNVLKNVIAHELGHAVGLRHDDDPKLLMCGRPAPCRPDAFQSDTPHFFPLSEAEKARLRSLYPSDWSPR